MERGTLLSLPNLLSLSRLGLAALFVVVTSAPWRVATVALAALTDVLDGWLARRGGRATRFGALLDPITDRFFVFVAVCTFLVEGALGTWEYFVVISRDFMTAIGFLVARAMPSLRPVTFRARPGGKIVTTLQLLVLGAVLVAPAWVTPMLVALGIASLAAVVDYTLMLHRERKKVLAGLGGGGALVLLALLAPTELAAQQRSYLAPLVRPGLRAQWRDPRAVEAGPLLAIVASRTVRVDVALLGGVLLPAAGAEASRPTARAEVVGRFLLDPFAERRLGLYGGAGVALQCVRGVPCAPFLVVRVGAEGRPWGAVRPALEGGIGGGAHLAVVLRRAAPRTR